MAVQGWSISLECFCGPARVRPVLYLCGLCIGPLRAQKLELPNNTSVWLIFFMLTLVRGHSRMRRDPVRIQAQPLRNRTS